MKRPPVTITISGAEGAGKTVIAMQLLRSLIKNGCERPRHKPEATHGPFVTIHEAPHKHPHKIAFQKIAHELDVTIIEERTDKPEGYGTECAGQTVIVKKVKKKKAKKSSGF